MANAPMKDSTEPKKNGTILVIDDDRAILDTFRTLLEREGHEVDVAENGAEAIDKSQKKYYDLAVIDVKLPDMEGTQLLSNLRSNFPRTKKIVITGYPALENAAMAVNLRADAYIVKPVKPQEFLKIVKEKLQEHDEEENVTEEKVMDWVETRYLKAKQKSTGQTQKRQPSKP